MTSASDQFLETAHLFLGITREELKRRLACGQVDAQILKIQIQESSRETQLEALCEKWIESRSLEQIDKFSSDDIALL